MSSDATGKSQPEGNRRPGDINTFEPAPPELPTLSEKAIDNLNSLPAKGWGRETLWANFDTVKPGEARTGHVVLIVQKARADQERTRNSCLKNAAEIRRDGERGAKFWEGMAEGINLECRYLIKVAHFKEGSRAPLEDIFQFNESGKAMNTARDYGGWGDLEPTENENKKRYRTRTINGIQDPIDPVVMEMLKERFKIVEAKLEMELSRLHPHDEYAVQVSQPPPTKGKGR